MQIGIFAKTFSRKAVDEVFDAVHNHGIACVQFNMACCGLPSMPDSIEPAIARGIAESARSHHIDIAAVSGTFNMIHPDPQQRRAGLRRLAALATAARDMGTSLITLCTGSRDPDNMWARHPDNDTPEAWTDLTACMSEALKIADDHDVQLGIEPEVSNTIDTAAKARRLLDEMDSPRLKIVMDAANLFHTGELSRMGEILEEAFDMLGRDIAIAHAKDLSRDGEAGHDAAGTGVLDYPYYIRLLRRYQFNGPLILHSLTEAQVPACVAFLRRQLAS